METAHRHTLLRDALIGGGTVALAVVAQQESATAELRLIGLVAIFGGLLLTGLFSARDAGGVKRDAASRTGAAAGILAGLIASLALIAISLIWSVNGMTAQRIQEALIELYTPQQLALFAENGLTLDVLEQYTTLLQIVCCGAGLPVLGAILGAIGGAVAPDVFRSDRQKTDLGKRK